MNRKLFPALVGILSACLATTAYAEALVGSGDHLPYLPFGKKPNEPRSIIFHDLDVDFIGEWNAPALFPWLGTFHATGPIPAGTGNDTGLTTYDSFLNLNAGFLPMGTMFRFGDVDSGSGQTETFTLNAWDLNGMPITGPWLDVPNGVYGTGRGPDGNPALEDMPGWDFNAITGTYFIDGTTVVGFNPNVAFTLTSNTNISSFTVFRNSGFANFSLKAPIPEPCTAALTIAFVWCRRRRRRRAC